MGGRARTDYICLAKKNEHTMSTGFYKVPVPKNERVINYSPGTKERATLKAEIEKLGSQVIDIPMIINGQEVRTDHKVPIYPPHNRKHLLGHYYKGDASQNHGMETSATMATPNGRCSLFRLPPCSSTTQNRSTIPAIRITATGPLARTANPSST